VPALVPRPDMDSPLAAMRRGEITHLRRHHVDLTRRILTLQLSDSKERSWKRVPLRVEQIPLLEEAMKTYVLGSDPIVLPLRKLGIGAKSARA
jgi:integrase